MKRQNLLTIIILISFLLIGFILGVKFPTLSIRPGKDVATVDQLKKMQTNKNYTLINVHTPYTGEIPKTDLFVPFDQIVAFSDSLPKDKNTPIILYCETGRMSAEALETFKKLGYTNVRHLLGGMAAWKRSDQKLLDLSRLGEEVLPGSGVELPIPWGDLGPQLVALGVIDPDKLSRTLTLTSQQQEILSKVSPENIRIDKTNVQFVVDMLWALGLAQKSIVYDQGPMGKEYKDNVANFASTGGWDQGKGNAMLYYNKYDLIPLTAQQQQKVAVIAQNVYRPCCGNSTYFPDCNHGMAALAMIELMANKGLDEGAIYKNILAFNSFWFPDTYLTTATYFARQGTDWRDVDAKKVMGAEYSSGQGASEISKKVGPLPGQPNSGSSCGA